MAKKTNEDEEDWSDIRAMIEALHDDTANTVCKCGFRDGIEAWVNF